MPVPTEPKIYHIVHVDRLPSIIKDGFLWCDAKITQGAYSGTTIGKDTIKQQRLKNPLQSYKYLCVGDCVPFNFCPRSTMLYIIYMANLPELPYRGGQEPIVHLEADLHEAVEWANQNQRRWAFTLSNAGSRFFEDRCDLAQLDEINWNAVQAKHWSGDGISMSVKEGKQAEFLIEREFPWDLISRIGVRSHNTYNQVNEALKAARRMPQVGVLPSWYYWKRQT